MSTENVKRYYISSLHAFRSASEQGAAAASVLHTKADDPTLKQIMATYRDSADASQKMITAFLKDLGEAPNDFKDRVMEGVGNGMEEMMKAAPDDSVMDLAVISASETGVQYFSQAFATQPPMAKALGLPDQASQWAKMTQEWETIDKRLSEVAESVLETALSA